MPAELLHSAREARAIDRLGPGERARKHLGLILRKTAEVMKQVDEQDLLGEPPLRDRCAHSEIIDAAIELEPAMAPAVIDHRFAMELGRSHAEAVERTWRHLCYLDPVYSLWKTVIGAGAGRGDRMPAPIPCLN